MLFCLSKLQGGRERVSFFFQCYEVRNPISESNFQLIIRDIKGHPTSYYGPFTWIQLELSQWCGLSNCDSWILSGTVVGMWTLPEPSIGRQSLNRYVDPWDFLGLGLGMSCLCLVKESEFKKWQTPRHLALASPCPAHVFPSFPLLHLLMLLFQSNTKFNSIYPPREMK